MTLSEEQLRADIKAGKLTRVYFIYGEEEFFIRSLTEMLINRAMPKDARELNLDVFPLTPVQIRGSKVDSPPNIGSLLDIAGNIPMFSEKRAVYLKNLNAEYIDKEQLDGYLDLIANVPDTCVLIITREMIESDPKKFNESLKKSANAKLIEAVNRYGVVCNVGKADSERLANLTIVKLGRAGCSISEENALYLAQAVGNKAAVLQKELDKLISCKPHSEITREDIDSVVPKVLEANIYALSGELLSGRPGAALQLLDTLYAKGENSTNILRALSSQYLDCYIAKLAIAAKVNSNTAAKDYNYFGNRSYGMKKAFQSAGGVSENYLCKAIGILYNTNRLLHSSGLDERVILEQAIVEIGCIPRR